DGSCLFFFQAEDGIRDSSVTGVQTCALPIFPAAGDGGDRPDGPDLLEVGGAVDLGGVEQLLPDLGDEVPQHEDGGDLAARRGHRSEERRVGKEWRTRGWPGA